MIMTVHVTREWDDGTVDVESRDYVWDRHTAKQGYQHWRMLGWPTDMTQTVTRKAGGTSWTETTRRTFTDIGDASVPQMTPGEFQKFATLVGGKKS